MTDEAEPTRRGLGRMFAGGGVLTGLGALIGASCCVLPLVLAQLGVSTALVAHLAIFTEAKPYLLATTAALIAAGFVAAFWGGRRPRVLTLVLLVTASALVLAAYLTPRFEPEILNWMGMQ